MISPQRNFVQAIKRCWSCNRRLHASERMACSGLCDPSLLSIHRMRKALFTAAVLVTVAVATGAAIMTVMVLV